jgi:hypothetical protein
VTPVVSALVNTGVIGWGEFAMAAGEIVGWAAVPGPENETVVTADEP